MKLSEETKQLIGDFPEYAPFWERIAQLEADNAALQRQVEGLREVITNDGKYTWYHFETWANGIENKQRHPSILTKWLFAVSRLVKQFEAGGE